MRKDILIFIVLFFALFFITTSFFMSVSQSKKYKEDVLLNLSKVTIIDTDNCFAIDKFGNSLKISLQEAVELQFKLESK